MPARIDAMNAAQWDVLECGALGVWCGVVLYVYVRMHVWQRAFCSIAIICCAWPAVHGLVMLLIAQTERAMHTSHYAVQ